ncbi:MAG: peptide chain release factor N(5)-glutamine methyltransferase [Acidimicrobiales bacterium]
MNVDPDDVDPGELEGTVRWEELLAETEGRLRAADLDGNPTLHARWIVEEIVGSSATHFREGLQQPATVRAVAKLDSMVQRRCGGEPIQYVLGHWAFRELDLLVDDRVLIPRPETEIVAGLVLDELDRLRPPGSGQTGTVVDLGSGSGAIGLSVASERPGTRVVLTDSSDDALAVARANLAGLGMRGASVEVHAGSWFDALPERLRGECDVVASNPPYVPAGDELPASVEAWEPASALRSGADGLDDLRKIVADARPWLGPAGAIVLEMDPRQIEPMTALLQEHGFDTGTHPDLAGRHRAIVARLRT